MFVSMTNALKGQQHAKRTMVCKKAKEASQPSVSSCSGDITGFGADVGFDMQTRPRKFVTTEVLPERPETSVGYAGKLIRLVSGFSHDGDYKA